MAGLVRDVRDGRAAPLVHREPPIVATHDALSARTTASTSSPPPARWCSRPPGWRSSSCWPSARRPPRSAITFARTLRQLKLPIVTIAFILSIATVMNYSGMTSSMALALAATGVLFPFFSAFIGMLGVFLTGSDTSSNTLFGPLQATTAKVSGLDPILMAATNSSGGVMGKMISPQNLSVGAAGVGAVGREGEIFRRVIGHSLVLTSLMGLAGDAAGLRRALDGPLRGSDLESRRSVAPISRRIASGVSERRSPRDEDSAGACHLVDGFVLGRVRQICGVPR